MPRNPPGRGPRPRPSHQPSQQGDPQERDRYWLARRSLRVWPIQGPDPRSSLIVFLRDRLGLVDNQFLGSMGQVTIKMICANPRAAAGRSDPPKIRDEATVIFYTVEMRDAVRSAAANLAKTPEPCGLRLEIPQHLKSNFKVLENTAFKIRKKNPGSKTNVKFSDELMGLVLDFKTNDSDWRTISPECARAVKGDGGSVDNATLSRLVGS